MHINILRGTLNFNIESRCPGSEPRLRAQRLHCPKPGSAIANSMTLKGAQKKTKLDQLDLNQVGAHLERAKKSNNPSKQRPNYKKGRSDGRAMKPALSFTRTFCDATSEVSPQFIFIFSRGSPSTCAASKDLIAF